MAVEVATQHEGMALARVDGAAERQNVLMTEENREVIQAIAYDVFASGKSYLPDHINTEEQAKVIMYFGWEIGLPPMASLQQIYVVHGKPGLQGQGMLALLDRRPDLGYYVWGPCNDDQASITLYKRVPTGEYVPQEFTFSMADARQAKIAGDMYQKYPRLMLRWRVVAEGMRSTFPGLLAGCAHTPEELGVQMTVEAGEVIVDQAALAAGVNTLNSPQAPGQVAGMEPEAGEVDFDAPGGGNAARFEPDATDGEDPMDVARAAVCDRVESLSLDPPECSIPDILGEDISLPPLSVKQLKAALMAAGLEDDDVLAVGNWLRRDRYPNGAPAKMASTDHQALWEAYAAAWQAGTLRALVYEALCQAADIEPGENPFGDPPRTEHEAETEAQEAPAVGQEALL